MKKNILELQDFVPRPESIQMKLSRTVWDWGLGAFFVENIPFSFRTGIVFARRIVTLLVQHSQQLSETGTLDAYHCYEFGAGFGLLARNILDLIEKEHPSLYPLIQYHISDISEAAIEQIETYGLMKAHASHVHLDIIDITRPKFKAGCQPHFILAAYLFDTLPAHHIEYSQGEIKEILIKTGLSKDKLCLDTSQFPPYYMTAKEIKALIEAKDTERLRLLSHRILSCFEETYTSVPIENSTTLSEEEKQHCRDFCASLPDGEARRFNLSFMMAESIKALVSELHQDGLIFISDFGQLLEDHSPVQGLISKYNTAQFYIIFFPYLHYIAQSLGADTWITEHDKYMQDMVISKQSLPEKLKTCFNDTFNSPGFENLETNLDKIAELPDNDDFLEQYQRIFSEFTKEEQQDYQSLIVIAEHLYGLGYAHEAHRLATLSLQSIHHLSPRSYRLLGYLDAQIGRYESARENFTKAIQLSTYDPHQFESLSLVLSPINHPKERIEAIRKELYYSREKAIWPIMLKLAKTYIQLKQWQKAQEIIGWIFQIKDQYPVLVPKQVEQESKLIMRLSSKYEPSQASQRIETKNNKS